MEATNNITIIEGQTIQARIDPNLTVNDVIIQLCANLKIQESPAKFALKDDRNELVTDGNLRMKIEKRANLRLVTV